MTKFQLLKLLTYNGTAQFLWQGQYYILSSIQREDGSGNSFILHCKNYLNQPCTIYIRTVD